MDIAMNASLCKVTLKKPEVCLWKWRPTLLGAQQSQQPACKGTRTSTREKETPRAKEQGEERGNWGGRAQGKGAADVTGTCRREGLLNQIESQAADVVSSSSWRPEHACPLCAAAAVAWVTWWNPRGQAEQCSSRSLMCWSCWNRTAGAQAGLAAFTSGHC